MIRIVFCILALLISTGAQAHNRHHYRHYAAHHQVIHHKFAARHEHLHHYADGRPSAWCGWFARFNFVSHDPGPAFNLAANWKHIGTPDSAPENGDIVVWDHASHHHVGKIVGACNGYMCPVWSGNDGHAVRTRVRSVADAVFRRL